MMEEYDRHERFVHADGRTADLGYGLDSGDFHAWLVAIESREDMFPDAHSTEARARAWLAAHGFTFQALVIEEIDDQGYVTERVV